MPSGSRQLGFAYVLLLVAVAIIALAGTSAFKIGANASRKDAENHLLFVGTQFEQALRSYAGLPENAAPTAAQVNANPAGSLAKGPRTLEELLKDPRVPGVRRHLRQIYSDPLTGSPTWGLAKDPEGFIVGVYSLAEGQPIKQAGFEAAKACFDQAQSYSAWVFGLPNAPLYAPLGASHPCLSQPKPKGTQNAT